MNLQEELVRADQKRQQTFSQQISLSAIESLLQKEGELEQNTLQRMGLLQNRISLDQRSWLTQCQLNEKYQGGVYYINDIRKVCIEYQMRMLPSALYRGPVDPLFASKVKRFRQEYQLGEETLETEFFIVAPPETFALEERQRPIVDIDPILLYRINGDYYRLVHQWGADLNLFRYVSAWRRRDLPRMTCHWMLMTFLFTMLFLGLFVSSLVNAVIVATLASGLIGWMYYSSLFDRPDELRHQFTKYNWNQTWTY